MGLSPSEIIARLQTRVRIQAHKIGKLAAEVARFKHTIGVGREKGAARRVVRQAAKAEIWRWVLAAVHHDGCHVTERRSATTENLALGPFVEVECECGLVELRAKHGESGARAIAEQPDGTAVDDDGLDAESKDVIDGAISKLIAGHVKARS